MSGPTIAERLAAPFIGADLEWKVQSCGKNRDGKRWALVVPYISARAIQNRLDEVMGISGWRNRFDPILKGGDVAGYLCALALKVEGEWVEKVDGADLSDIEPVKGGLSNALKRAAVQWGIGRYLYGMPEAWANIHERGQEWGKTKEGEKFRWDPPPVSATATTTQGATQQSAQQQGSDQQASNGPADRYAHVCGTICDRLGTGAGMKFIREIRAMYKAEGDNASPKAKLDALLALEGAVKERLPGETADHEAVAP